MIRKRFFKIAVFKALKVNFYKSHSRHYRFLMNGQITFCGRWESALSDYSILRFSRRCKHQTVKSSQSKLLSYILSAHTYILYPWVSIFSISRFLETVTREQQKYEKRTQKYVDNTVNGLRHEIKFEIRVKNMIIIIQLPRHFFAEADTKKRRYASAKASAFADC